MREAYGLASGLVKSGDTVQARMAFLESYRGKVQLARDGRIPVQWEFSPGHDKDGRELALLDAVQKGRLGLERARTMLPYHRDDLQLEARLLAAAGVRPLLSVPDAGPQPKRAGLIKLGDVMRGLRDKSKKAA
jgi:hypothetical protein